MSAILSCVVRIAPVVPLLAAAAALAGDTPAPGPRPDEEQLPRRMHSRMEERPVIRVGTREGDIQGADNRALQAAVDYVAGLGGGTVEVGPGEYLMRDSLHLRSFVTVRGVKGRTVLRKARGVSSPLALDGDYGEEQITVAEPEGFEVGHGVAIWDSGSGGFHTTVARITGRTGSTFSIDRPLNADCMVSNKARAATVFPVISGYDIEGARIEGMVIDGNRNENPSLNGCRGAGIFLYRGFGTAIADSAVRGYHGDGISFQQSNDVVVTDCLVEGNAGLGIHPGSGSQRPIVRGCVSRRNGEDGLFLCWRVRHGLFEKNVIEDNGRFGISIGHKDTDNILRENVVRSNHEDGVFFRNETAGMAGHRNRLERNVIEDNGLKGEAAGIRVRGETRDLVFRGNVIRDTRAPGARKQSVGIRLEEEAGEVTLEGNEIEARTAVEDLRKARPAAAAPAEPPGGAGHATLASAKLRAVIADNSGFEPAHRPGYSGVAELQHGTPARNIFVPAYSGLNFEHIWSGDSTSYGWDIFEPRRSPMKLSRTAENRVELLQEHTENWPLRSVLTYEIGEETIDFSIACVPRADAWRKHGYIGLFFASYIDAPEDMAIHFIGRTRSERIGGDSAEGMKPRWIRHLPALHGEAACHRAAGSDWDPAFDPGFNIPLASGQSDLEYIYPFYFGVSHGKVLVFLFDRPAKDSETRFAQSPSGGGKGNPAWDFLFLKRGYEVGKEFRFRARAVIREYTGEEAARKAAQEAYAEWSGEGVAGPK